MADPVNQLNDVTLAVLAGGEGSRMGGPKAELTVRGQPILQYLLERFAWPGPTLLVTAPGRQRPPAWDQFGDEAVDPVADQGPLRGLLTAIEHAKTSVLVIVTVDMPGIEQTHLRWLVEQLRDDALGLMTSRSVGERTLVEPFPMAVRSSAGPSVSKWLASGERSVRMLPRVNPRFLVVPAPAEWPAPTWINLNAPSDYEAFMR
jgi:molybdopterin-guanine dinucleotide biosynthesis protein A